MTTEEAEGYVEGVASEAYNFVCDQTPEEVSALYTLTKSRAGVIDGLIEACKTHQSPTAEIRYRRELAVLVLRMRLLESGEPIEDDVRRTYESIFRLLATQEDLLPHPRLYWKVHFLIARSEERSDGLGTMYQALVMTTVRPSIGECYAAVLNPQTFDVKRYPQIEAPNVFYSQEDGMVWAEGMFSRIASKAEKGLPYERF